MNSFYAILHRTPNKQGKPKEPWTQESERQDMKPVAHSKFFGQHEIRGLPLTRGHRKPTEKKRFPPPRPHTCCSFGKVRESVIALSFCLGFQIVAASGFQPSIWIPFQPLDRWIDRSKTPSTSS